jgi:hypothetical protein
MSKLPLVGSIVASILLTSGTRTIAQTFPSDLPMAIVCWNQGAKNWVVGYLQSVKDDGTATYKGQLSATVSAKRVVESPTNRPVIIDCYGKTLEQLRATGRVMEFQRAK